MHKFISEEHADVTRFVTLRNVETGTEDYCFDSSDMFDDESTDFSFMKIGQVYDCKILLYGEPHETQNGKHISCRVLRDNVPIGRRRVVEVKSGNDIYYVPYNDVENLLDRDRFSYYYSRKDLIMVDGVPDGFFLLDI